METRARAVIAEYLAKYKPLDLELRKAWYAYSTTGDKKQSAREAELELAIRKLSSDPERFAMLKELYSDRKEIKDATLRREVEVLYLTHLPNQVSAGEAREADRGREARRGGLQRLPRRGRRQEALARGRGAPACGLHRQRTAREGLEGAACAWARCIEKDYRDLVKLRNEIARDLGYKNALELSAVVSELDLAMLDRFYDEVTRATDKAFKKLKEEYIDPRLAKRYGIAIAELRPWHYQNAFFQEAPTAIFGKVDLDALYAKTDSKKVIDQTIALLPQHRRRHHRHHQELEPLSGAGQEPARRGVVHRS